VGRVRNQKDTKIKDKKEGQDERERERKCTDGERYKET